MDADGQIAISVEEAARRLYIGRNVAYELIHANKLPHVRVGRKYSVLVRGLEDAFTALAHEPTQEPRYGGRPSGRRGRR